MKNTVSKTIHSLLSRTIVNPSFFDDYYSFGNERVNDAFKPLSNYLMEHHPRKLFRMRECCPKTVDAFEKDKLYLSRADFFNDPYDCVFSFSKQRIQKTIEDSFSDQNLTICTQGMKYPFVVNSGEEIHSQKEWISWMKNNGSIPAFVGKAMQGCDNIRDKIQKSSFVGCFCENVDSPIMWSHYAKNHSGFAIEYQFHDDMFPPRRVIVSDSKYPWHGWRSILPVHYSKKRIDATAFASWELLCETWESLLHEDPLNSDFSIQLNDLLLPSKLALEKSIDWSYEHEWRLVISHNWPRQILNYKCCISYQPSAIYLGARMEKSSEKDRLISIAREKGIELYQMYVDYESSAYRMAKKRIE